MRIAKYFKSVFVRLYTEKTINSLCQFVCGFRPMSLLDTIIKFKLIELASREREGERDCGEIQYWWTNEQ